MSGIAQSSSRVIGVFTLGFLLQVVTERAGQAQLSIVQRQGSGMSLMPNKRHAAISSAKRNTFSVSIYTLQGRSVHLATLQFPL